MNTSSIERFRRASCFALVLILAVIAIVVMRDAYPKAYLTINRMNRATSLTEAEYLHAVYKRALVMLSKPELVPISDQTRLLLLDDLRSIRGNALTYSWPYAILAKGIVIADRHYRDEHAIMILEQYYAGLINEYGAFMRPITLDMAANGGALLYLATSTGQKKYLNACDELARYLKERAAMEGGLLYYRTDHKTRLVDTVGLVCPFLSAYGKMRHDKEAIDLAVAIIVDFMMYGIEPRSGLPYHGYNPEKGNAPIGIVGWGRGCGWYALGLADTLAVMEPSDPAVAILRNEARRFAASIVKYRRNSWGWANMLTSQHANFDSSATAMLCYFLENGLKQGYLYGVGGTDITHDIATLKSESWLNGTIDFASGDTMDFHRHSQNFSPAPYAQGMALAALSEHLTK